MTEVKNRFYFWIRRLVGPLFMLLFPLDVSGRENLPDEPVIVVANHSQMYGPIAGELYFPGKHYIWCAGQMMHWKEAPAYAFEDFWSQKPKRSQWFFKIASYLITPLCVLVFNHARTIPVYHDARLRSTFRISLEKLQTGASIIIFPEHDVKFNHIVYDFQDKFIDTARMYYQKTGVVLSFVPMYIAPKLGVMQLGKPIRFNPDTPIKGERARICDALKQEITNIACALPEHTVVPYRNIPKKLYPSNISNEVTYHEETCC